MLKYFIDGEEKTKEEFQVELEKQINDYIPYSEYWPKKEDIKDRLKEKREFRFPVYDKRYKDRLVLTNRIHFQACEEEILEMSEIIATNEYDACDDDCLQIAVALYNAGYRKKTMSKE